MEFNESCNSIMNLNDSARILMWFLQTKLWIIASTTCSITLNYFDCQLFLSQVKSIDFGCHFVISLMHIFRKNLRNKSQRSRWFKLCACASYFDELLESKRWLRYDWMWKVVGTSEFRVLTSIEHPSSAIIVDMMLVNTRVGQFILSLFLWIVIVIDRSIFSLFVWSFWANNKSTIFNFPTVK